MKSCAGIMQTKLYRAIRGNETGLNRQTWCPVVSPDFHGGEGGYKFNGRRGETTKYKTFVELYLGIILFYILTISKSTKKNQMLSEWSMLLYTS